jgi:hypothetical protein
MKRQLIIGAIITVFVILLCALVYPFIEEDQTSMNYPESMGGYENKGYYKIDPGTILASLDEGKANVFMPLLEDPNDIKESYTVSWTQADYLKIADALSQEVWKEPLELKDWKVLDIGFEKGCVKDIGFESFSMIYYKVVRLGFQIEYSTRYMDMSPSYGYVQWAGDGTFYAPLLAGFQRIDLTNFKIPAEVALQIAERNGGSAVRAQLANKCGISVYMPDGDTRNWYVNYGFFTVVVDAYSGSYKILPSKP